MSVVHPAIGGAIYQAIAGAFNLNREMGEPPAPEIDLIIAMFDGGRQGLWYKFSEFANLSQDTAGALPYTALDQPVGRVIDSSPRGNTATQITTTARPMIKQVVGQPKYLTTDGVDDRLLVTLPAIVGTMIVGMAEGTLVYTVNIPAGVFPIGTNTTAQRFSPSKKFTSYFIIAGVLSEGEIQTVIDHMQSNGAGPTNTLVGVTDTTLSWGNFTQMTSFPLLGFSKVTNATQAWYNCSGLTSFPLLDFSKVTNASYAWKTCSSLTSFPLLDFSNVTNAMSAWENDSRLTSFPLLDFSKVTNASYAWYNCSGLTSFPLLDFSKVTNASYAWKTCSSLTSFPLLDFSNVTNAMSAWENDSRLTSFPLLDFSKVTNISATWNSCSGLTSFPLLDLSNVTNATDAWSGCTKLTTFATGMFSTMKCTNFTNAFNSCKLTQSTVDNILTELVTANKSNGTVNITGGTSSAPSATGLAAKATLVSRGWTVTHN